MIKTFRIHYLLLAIGYVICLDSLSAEPYKDYKHNKKYFISKVDTSLISNNLVSKTFWESIDTIDDLVQVEPIFNSMPSYKTNIKLCYDESYIYAIVDLVQNKNSISYKRGEYDDFMGTFESKSDYFIIEIDSYHDHETGYGFAVNSSGIKSDYMIYNDEFLDDDWNAEWFSQVTSNENGWTIEYKIPFDILRYSVELENIWGINFIRYIKNKNEYMSWTAVPQDKMGIVSQFGHLEGLNLNESKVFQFKSHGVHGATSYDDSFYGYIMDDSNNIIGLDFEEGNEEYFDQNIKTGNIGFDIKYNINSNSNLDLTYKPDFNHINQDPSDINNTAYETYYSERRDFFLENSVFFQTPIQIFYSRRVGGIEKNENSYFSFMTNLVSATKYTFKDNKTKYGLIFTYSKPSINRSVSNTYDIYSSIFRASWKIIQDKFNIGVIGTNKSTKMSDTNVYAFDFSSNFINNQFYFDSQLAVSDRKSELGDGTVFKAGFRSNNFNMLQNEYYIDFWVSNNKYDTTFNINDLGYLFRNDLNEYNIGLSLNNEGKFKKTNFIVQYYNAKNYSGDILSDILSFKYNIKSKNSSYLLIGASKEFEHYNDRYYDYFFNLDLDKTVKAPNNTTLNVEYGSNLTNNFSYTLNVKSFRNNLKDKGKNYVFDINYDLNSWIEFDFSYDRMKYYETYHFLKIRQLPSGINFSNVSINNFRDEYQYLFINSHNKEYYYTMKISSYLKKCILQLYSEYYVYSNKWGENDNIYQISKLDANYTYPNLVNVDFSNLIDYETDKILYSAFYTSMNLNFVIEFDFLQNSNIYFLYRFNKGVNGKVFSNPKKLIDFNTKDSNNESIAEIYYDHSFFIKYEFLIRNK